MIHARHPCKTCPFRRELRGGAFPPDLLDETVGVNLRQGQYAHRCHVTLGADTENVCVGFLRFVTDNQIHNSMVQFGQRLGVIDLTRLSSDVPICSTWDEVLSNHQRALGGDDDRRE